MSTSNLAYSSKAIIGPSECYAVGPKIVIASLLCCWCYVQFEKCTTVILRMAVVYYQFIGHRLVIL